MPCDCFCMQQAQQRELTVQHVKQTEKELGHQLKLQREQYEAAIQRHLAFIDQVVISHPNSGASEAGGGGGCALPGCPMPFLRPAQLINDKKVLSEKCEAVVAELKQVDQKYGKKLTQMQEQHELVREQGQRGTGRGDVPWPELGAFAQMWSLPGAVRSLPPQWGSVILGSLSLCTESPCHLHASPGSPGGSCPPLPRTRSVVLSKGQSPLPGALLGQTHTSLWDGAVTGGLTSAELTADTGTNRGTCPCGQILLSWTTSSPFEERGWSWS